MPEHPSGVEDGTILETLVHSEIPNTPVEIRQERVVFDVDGSWHKEVVE
jgi:hypothetical protein